MYHWICWFTQLVTQMGDDFVTKLGLKNCNCLLVLWYWVPTINWIGQKGRLQFIGSLRHYFTLAWGWGERKMVKGIHRHSGTCMSRSSRSGPSSTGSQGSCWSPAAGKAPREECAKKFTADISSWPGLLFLWDRHKCSTRHKGNIYFQKKFLISHGGDINK